MTPCLREANSCPRRLMPCKPPLSDGAHLRIARVRPSMLGVDRHVIADAERGKITTRIAGVGGATVGAASAGPNLSVWPVQRRLEPVADPALDEEGLALAMNEARTRAYPCGRSAMTSSCYVYLHLPGRAVSS